MRLFLPILLLFFANFFPINSEKEKSFFAAKDGEFLKALNNGIEVPKPANEKNMEHQASTPIRFSKLRTEFEYISIVQIFGQDYKFTIGFNGVVSGRMMMNIKKEMGDGRVETVQDFGGALGDYDSAADEFDGENEEEAKIGNMSKKEAEAMLSLNDFLGDQVHKKVAELTERAQANKKRGEKPELGEEFTKELAERLIDGLSAHQHFGDAFKGLNPKHRKPNKKGLLQHIQSALVGVKDRLTPVKVGAAQIRLSVTQKLQIDKNVQSRVNVLLNMTLSPEAPPQSCFEIFVQTEEKSSGRLLDVHLKTEDGPPQVKIFCSNKFDAKNVRNANPMDLLGFVFRNTDVVKGVVQKAVLTVATPAMVVTLAQRVLLPVAAAAISAMNGNGGGRERRQEKRLA